jgi:hypothetical protein
VNRFLWHLSQAIWLEGVLDPFQKPKTNADQFDFSLTKKIMINRN